MLGLGLGFFFFFNKQSSWSGIHLIKIIKPVAHPKPKKKHKIKPVSVSNLSHGRAGGDSGRSGLVGLCPPLLVTDNYL